MTNIRKAYVTTGELQVHPIPGRTQMFFEHGHPGVPVVQISFVSQEDVSPLSQVLQKNGMIRKVNKISLLYKSVTVVVY